MPASPRATSKNVKVQAKVNLSLVRHEKGADGQIHPFGTLVHKGDVVEMTEAEVANFGRFVQVIDDEHPAIDKNDMPKQSPAKAFGIPFIGKNGGQLKGSGAMDMGEETRVMRAEASVFEDQ